RAIGSQSRVSREKGMALALAADAVEDGVAVDARARLDVVERVGVDDGGLLERVRDRRPSRFQHRQQLCRELDVVAARRLDESFAGGRRELEGVGEEALAAPPGFGVPYSRAYLPLM